LTRKDSSNGFAAVAIILGEFALVGARCSRQLRRGLRARKDAPTLQNLRRKVREISGHDCPVDRGQGGLDEDGVVGIGCGVLTARRVTIA